MSRYSKAMSEIIRDVEGGSAPHWFSRETMAFFGSRLENYPVSRSNDAKNRRFFITSEDDYDRRLERVYSIRYASTTNGDTQIFTLGEPGAYASLGAAASAITGLFDLALDIGWDAVVDMESLR